MVAQLLKPLTGVHSIHPRVNRMSDFFQLSLRKVIQPSEVIGIPQLRNTDSLGLIYLQTAIDDFLEIAGDGRPHLAAIEWQRQVIPEIILQFAEGVGSIAVQQFIYEDSECPDIRLRAIDAINVTLRRHIQRRSDV